MATSTRQCVLLASVICTLLDLARAATETCVSQQGYVFQPKPPRRKALSKPLSFYTQYSRRTCCSPMITDRIMRLSALAKAAEHNLRCRRMSELMACSVCHPDVGTGKLRTVCTRTCDEWYRACEQEFYSTNSDGSLRPCFGNALVCSPLSHIAQSGTAFCKRMGYTAAGSIDAAAEAERQLTLGKRKRRAGQGKDKGKRRSENMDNDAQVDSDAGADTDDGRVSDTDVHTNWGLDGEEDGDEHFDIGRVPVLRQQPRISIFDSPFSSSRSGAPSSSCACCCSSSSSLPLDSPSPSFASSF